MKPLQIFGIYSRIIIRHFLLLFFYIFQIVLCIHSQWLTTQSRHSAVKTFLINPLLAGNSLNETSSISSVSILSGLQHCPDIPLLKQF